MFALANNIVILPVISSISILSKLIAPTTFIKYKNLIIMTLSLATSIHITIDNTFTI